MIAMFDRIVSALGATAATAVLLATLAAATPPSAQAVARAPPPLAGRDLSRPAEAARLDREIRMAAGAVCDHDGAWDMHKRPTIEACEKDAVARAHTDVQLALHSRGGSAVVMTVR